jgi:hypothetical protein
MCDKTPAQMIWPENCHLPWDLSPYLRRDICSYKPANPFMKTCGINLKYNDKSHNWWPNDIFTDFTHQRQHTVLKIQQRSISFHLQELAFLDDSSRNSLVRIKHVEVQISRNRGIEFFYINSQRDYTFIKARFETHNDYWMVPNSYYWPHSFGFD